MYFFPLRRLSPDNVHHVLEALANLVAHPEQADIRKLQGRTEEWRLRVGDTRFGTAQIARPEPTSFSECCRAAGPIATN